MSFSTERELTRRRYLDAMGITAYLARVALPGAAPVQRLVVDQRRAVALQPAVDAEPVASPAAERAGAAITGRVDPANGRGEPGLHSPPTDRRRSEPREETRFSLAVLFAGDLAWLEDLQGRALANDQVALVLAMARAVSGNADLQGSVQFDWPPHHNQQFDLGPNAARASLAGFLGRQLEQRGCRGIVLLGEGHTALVPGEQFPTQRLVRTASSADMLADHRLKRRAWQDLQPLVTRP
jgi:hypothetical protein